MPRAPVTRSVGVLVVGLAALIALSVAAPAARADATGQVAGRVVDGSGAPLAGICIVADTLPYPGGQYAGTVTDAQGDYTVALPPATYAISFQGCGQNYVTQFYPGQANLEQAGQVTVTAGRTSPGIDARMAVGGTITGKLVDQATGAPPPQYEIAPSAEPVLPPAAPSNPFADVGVVAADGTYTITGLAPGNYRVYLRPDSAYGVTSPYAAAWYPDAPDPGHAAVLSVASGQTAPLGVELAELPGTVTGRVTDLAGVPLAGYVVSASIPQPDGSGFPELGFVTTGPDGSFTLTGLAPGTWTISADRNGDGGYVRSQSATVEAGATTPNLDFAFCAAAECPSTQLLTVRAQIADHELVLAGQISDPANALFTVVLRGHIGRRAVKIRAVDVQARGGYFNTFVALPRRDRGLRSGVLALHFLASDDATGGRFVVNVPTRLTRRCACAEPLAQAPAQEKTERRHSRRVGSVIEHGLPLRNSPR